MRVRFEQQLAELNDNMIAMCTLIERAISRAVKALVNQDTELARQTAAGDAEVNAMEKEIERRCLQLLLQQQPIARDLRQISSALKMVTDMERIGDHAADISEVTLHMADRPYAARLEHIPQMAREAIDMLNNVIEAFVQKDLVMAEEVILQDDKVDDLFQVVRQDLVEMIRADPEQAEQAIDFIMIAKYLERIGDHVVNMAEWVVFSMTGRHKG